MYTNKNLLHVFELALAGVFCSCSWLLDPSLEISNSTAKYVSSCLPGYTNPECRSIWIPKSKFLPHLKLPFCCKTHWKLFTRSQVNLPGAMIQPEPWQTYTSQSRYTYPLQTGDIPWPDVDNVALDVQENMVRAHRESIYADSILYCAKEICK